MTKEDPLGEVDTAVLDHLQEVVHVLVLGIVQEGPEVERGNVSENEKGVEKETGVEPGETSHLHLGDMKETGG